MTEEFNLSDCLIEGFSSQFGNSSCIQTKDVKEFIKRLKESIEFDDLDGSICLKIDKLAGEKLTK